MKNKTLICLVCGIAIACTSGFANNGADGPPSAGAGAHKQGGPGGETRLLQHLLQLEDHELANLRHTIERIEKMPLEEKQQLRERIGKMQKMGPGRVQAMREKYEAIPEQEREAMRKRWAGLSSKERQAWREKFKHMSNEERQAVQKEQGFLLPPPQKDREKPDPPYPMDPKEPPAEPLSRSSSKEN
jgi:hypothetical protein